MKQNKKLTAWVTMTHLFLPTNHYLCLVQNTALIGKHNAGIHYFFVFCLLFNYEIELTGSSCFFVIEEGRRSDTNLHGS